MKIMIAENAGFCTGVNNTLKNALNVLNNGNDVIYSLGQIVHNEYVINVLKEKGLIVKNSIDEIPNGSKVIIRAHGESIEIYQKAKEKNIEIIDLTCKIVKSIQLIIEKEMKDSYVVIIGKKNHPETIAHKSISKNSYVIENIDDIDLFINNFKKKNFSKILIVVQTTFSEDLFNKIVLQIKNKLNNIEINIKKTICNATKLRQKSVKILSKNVNKMIIIGGKNSSNTKELYEISKKECPDSYFIQDINELKKITLNHNDIIGIAAGASTPINQIEDIVNCLEKLDRKI